MRAQKAAEPKKMCKFAYTIKKYAQLLIIDVMARFYSLKKKDEEDARIADPFGVLRSVPKTSSGKQTKEQHIMTKVYVFLADGFEDVEALAPVDVLRRGGVGVVTVSINGSDMVKSAHNVYVKADVRFEEANFSDADLLMIPGGMPGAKNLDEHEGVRNALLAHAKQGKITAAICAAPSVLGNLGILKGKKATCFPGFEKELEGATYTAAPVEIDGNVITGKGAGCAILFGKAIVEKAVSAEAANKVCGDMQCP